EVVSGLTIEQAIEKYLIEVQATKGVKTYRQYRNELEWSRKYSTKRYRSCAPQASTISHITGSLCADRLSRIAQ
ncbi:MAG: hypothetical protein WBQ94_22665, partial [Terracidiphilus sp.]